MPRHDQPPVFVINLLRSERRRRAMEDRLAGAAVAAEFVEAIDGRTLAADGRERLVSDEMAAVLSHCSVYERIVADRLPLAIVLEDDCLLPHAFRDVVRSVAASAGRWDVLLLGHHSARHDVSEGAETCLRGAIVAPGVRIARVAEFPMGAYAYAVTLAGARKLLSHAYPLRMPIDWVIGYSPSAGVRLCAVTPPCVLPDPVLGGETTIDGRPRASVVAARPVRDWGGRILLGMRKLGIRPDSYVKAPE